MRIEGSEYVKVPREGTQSITEQRQAHSFSERLNQSTKESKSKKQSKHKVHMSPFEKKYKLFKALVHSKSVVIFSKADKEIVWDFLRNDGLQVLTKPQDHKYVWLKCSGAYNQLLMNPGYYE